MRAVLAWIAAAVILGPFVHAHDAVTGPCTFSLHEPAAAGPSVIGDQEIVDRFRMIPQPDSPLETREVDLRKFLGAEHEVGLFAPGPAAALYISSTRSTRTISALPSTSLDKPV